MPRRKPPLQYLVFENDEDRGRLPPHNGSNSSDSAPRHENPVGEISAHKKRIVIVDDDPLVRTIFQKILKMNGFDVLASLGDGQELIESLEKMRPLPEVILLDERMPRMSGVEATKAIRSKYPGLAIIFVSADDSAKERAKEAGAKAFISKPITARNLIRALSAE